MVVQHRTHIRRRLYYSYLSKLRLRDLANVRCNREFYINLYNYLTYNDVD